jgi:Protein phosphatase 2C
MCDETLHEFLARGGTVVGVDHRRALRNNQDGLAFACGGGWHVVAVTDGCSSGRASEVGARLGAAYLAARTLDLAPRARDVDDAAASVGAATLAWLDGLAASFGEARRKDAIADMLLFTFLVAAIGPERAVVFGVGDGVVSLNGVTLALDPGPDNAPPYLAYGLLGRAPAPTVHVDVPACDVRTLAVATDGAVELLARARELLEGGAPQRGLDQFEEDVVYLRNPSLLQKRLVVIGERHGRLHDDTTIGLLRRKELAPCAS